MKSNSLLPVILAGGFGTRLWPLSRSGLPKQYLALNEGNKNSMLQQTQLRLNHLNGVEDPIIICNEEHRFILAEQMREINITPKSILLEPFPKNTAPAILSAAIKATNNGDDPCLLILSADHMIQDVKKFLLIIERAKSYSELGKIVTFGVVPYSPETGLGYIKAAEPFKDKLQASEILKFVEKPNLNLAKQLIKDKSYYWNSGIFLAKASTLISEFKLYCKELIPLCKESLEDDLLDLDFQRLKQSSFKKCPNISIDKAIMEKTKVGMVLPLEVGWSDLGSWDAIWEISKKDKHGNAFSGKVISDLTKNCLIKSEKKLIVSIGIENLIIVDTDDALLVVNKSQTQKVKNIITELKKIDADLVKNHQKVYRPWGNYTLIAKGNNWQLKTLEVKPKARLSLQRHNHRSEHWIVVKGIAAIEIDGNKKIINENQSDYIPLGSKHRLSNPSEELLVMIEIQSGDYLGEDDIERFEDIYGRVNFK